KDGVNISLPNPTGCADVTVDANLPSTIAALKAKKPGIKIFGNVYGALDASSEWGCGQTPPKALVQQWAEIKDESELSGMPEADWSCPGGICSNFVTYVEKWIEAGATGIAIEFAGPIYMNATALRSEISYVKNRGLDVMLNIPI